MHRITLRVWFVIGTGTALAVGFVLLIGAYAGWTFWLAAPDKSTTVIIALTFSALLFGVVAAFLALAAYLTASGVPRLTVEIKFTYSESNRPVIRIVDPQPDQNGSVLIPSGKDATAYVTVRNNSRYSARNPGVRLQLHGFGGVGVKVPHEGWAALNWLSTVGVTTLQWDGGTEQIIHGGWSRKLPDFTLGGARVYPSMGPEIIVTFVADGVRPVTNVVPVRLLNTTAHNAYTLQQRQGKVAAMERERNNLRARLKHRVYRVFKGH